MTLRRFRWIRWILISLAFFVLPLAFAIGGTRELEERQRPGLLPRLEDRSALPEAPAYDPSKPTVAVLLGADVTEITDALGPYEMFARAGAFNVVTVASEREPTLLSGGLRILPHYSLDELDARLEGDPPSIVIVPNIPNIASDENRPLVEWMQRQAAAGALMHSWCTGAMALAEAGLLDGLTATAHWGDLDRLEEQYPRVEWVRGVRWVDHGSVITSAGLTSGVDASLRVLTKVAGEDVARRVADELRYPNFHFASDPAVQPYTLQPSDAILLANATFRLSRQQIGLALYDGVGELDLSNLYDTHAYSAIADVEAIAVTSGFVRSAHGLASMPSLVADAETDGEVIDRLDRFVVPGRNGQDLAADVVAAVASLAPELAPTYVQSESVERFGLEPVLEDLARTADLPTARFAMRRLEYRSETVRLEGDAVAWATLPLPWILGSLGVFVALVFLRRAAGLVG
jgi:putative intracellular protease/amidase